jgi:hypothetical protein
MSILSGLKNSPLQAGASINLILNESHNENEDKIKSIIKKKVIL